MYYDPIEDTEQFKAIEKEVEHKVYQAFLDNQILALKDIIENGFTSYRQEWEAFGIGRLPELTENLEEIPPSQEEAQETEQNARQRLKEIMDLLESGELKQAYDGYIVKGLGFCHGYWKTKKDILKEEYSIDWKTPVEMNPGVMFD